MRVEYSQLPSFFVDLARLVEDFRQQNRQLRDHVEVADCSSWHVADAMEGGKALFSNPDPAVLTEFKEGVKVCKELVLATGKTFGAKGRTKSRWGSPKAAGERGDSWEIFSKSVKSVLGELTRARAPRSGQPKHCWQCGEEGHLRADCPKNAKKK